MKKIFQLLAARFLSALQPHKAPEKKADWRQAEQAFHPLKLGGVPRRNRSEITVQDYINSAFPSPTATQRKVFDALVNPETGQHNAFSEGFSSTWNNMPFPGFDVLAQLLMQPEMNRILSLLADASTRSGFKIVSRSNDKNNEKRCGDIAEKMRGKYGMQKIMRELVFDQLGYGRAHLYTDLEKTDGTRAYDDDEELLTPITLTGKFGKGQLKGFRVVQPRWVYPREFNAVNSLAPDFYQPELWMAMPTKVVHRTRLLPFIGKPVPDVLKPSYLFAGLPLTLLLEADIENWQHARNGVAELIGRFAKVVFKTDAMMTTTNLGDSEVSAQMMSRMRHLSQSANHDLLVLAKGGGDGSLDEEMDVLSVPLAGVEGLLDKLIEQVSMKTGTPAMMLYGDAPSGMNASGEGVLEVFAQNISAIQQQYLADHMQTILQYILISEEGQADEDLVFSFVPIDQLTEKEQVEILQIKATIDQTYVAMGAIDSDDVAKVLASEKDGRYQGLDVSPSELDEEGDDEQETAQ